jgi:hypothetical protein
MIHVLIVDDNGTVGRAIEAALDEPFSLSAIGTVIAVARAADRPESACDRNRRRA